MADLTNEQRRAVRKSPGGGAFLVALIIVIAAGVYYWREQNTSSSTAAPAHSPVAAMPTPAPTGSPNAATTAPPKPAAGQPPVTAAAGQALAQKLVRGLTGDRRVALWSDEPNLLRRWVTATYLFSQGDSPRMVLGFLLANRPFDAEEHDGHLYETAGTEARYDSVVDALKDIDPNLAAKAYGQLRPYAQVIFAEVGRPGQTFDAVLRSGIAKIDATVVPDKPLELRAKGAGYEYVDPNWENLTAAQKALIRLGAKNARVLQDWTSDFLRALPPAAT